MLTELGGRAHEAARRLALASSEQKNAALLSLAEGLSAASAEILAANQEDVAGGRGAGLSEALLDRLTLNEARLAGIAADLRQVAALPDPVGERFDQAVMPNGLQVWKRAACRWGCWV